MPTTVCQPPIQNYAAPAAPDILVGQWRWYPACNDWFWEGQKRSLTHGWVGDPWSGYHGMAKPSTGPQGQPLGTTGTPTPSPVPTPVAATLTPTGATQARIRPPSGIVGLTPPSGVAAPPEIYQPEEPPPEYAYPAAGYVPSEGEKETAPPAIGQRPVTEEEPPPEELGTPPAETGPCKKWHLFLGDTAFPIAATPSAQAVAQATGLPLKSLAIVSVDEESCLIQASSGTCYARLDLLNSYGPYGNQKYWTGPQSTGTRDYGRPSGNEGRFYDKLVEALRERQDFELRDGRHGRWRQESSYRGSVGGLLGGIRYIDPRTDDWKRDQYVTGFGALFAIKIVTGPGCTFVEYTQYVHTELPTPRIYGLEAGRYGNEWSKDQQIRLGYGPDDADAMIDVPDPNDPKKMISTRYYVEDDQVPVGEFKQGDYGNERKFYVWVDSPSHGSSGQPSAINGHLNNKNADMRKFRLGGGPVYLRDENENPIVERKAMRDRNFKLTRDRHGNVQLAEVPLLGADNYKRDASGTILFEEVQLRDNGAPVSNPATYRDASGQVVPNPEAGPVMERLVKYSEGDRPAIWPEGGWLVHKYLGVALFRLANGKTFELKIRWYVGLGWQENLNYYKDLELDRAKGTSFANKHLKYLAMGVVSQAKV